MKLILFALWCLAWIAAGTRLYGVALFLRSVAFLLFALGVLIGLMTAAIPTIPEAGYSMWWLVLSIPAGICIFAVVTLGAGARLDGWLDERDLARSSGGGM